MTPETAAASDSRLDSRRRWVYGFWTLVWLLLAVEGVAQLAVWLMHGSSWPREQQRLATHGTTKADAGEIVHPYIGSAFDPTHPPEHLIAGKPMVINRLGFSHPTEPVQRRDADRLIVGVTGGSVAWHMTCMAEERLLARLREIPDLRDKEIRIVCLAMGAHKQPQQLMALNYVLSLGGEFDVVLNLDGFNEVALGEWDYRRGVSPAYPRAWPNKLPTGFDLETVSDRFRMWEIRAERQGLARAVRGSWLRLSAVRQLWWKAADRQLQSEESQLMPRMTEGALREQNSFLRLGPLEEFSTDAEMYARFAEIWSNSSLAMHALGQGRGFVYVHCLQPNQYDPDSKPLSEEELLIAYSRDSEYLPSVIGGYPLLRAAGERLRADGVRFHDLTRLFADNADTLYGDDCCHFNLPGYQLLADGVAAAIREELTR